MCSVAIIHCPANSKAAPLELKVHNRRPRVVVIGKQREVLLVTVLAGPIRLQQTVIQDLGYIADADRSSAGADAWVGCATVVDFHWPPSGQALAILATLCGLLRVEVAWQVVGVESQ